MFNVRIRPRDGSDKRVEYQQLLADTKAGTVTEVHIRDATRLGNVDPAEFLNTVKGLRLRGCRLREHREGLWMTDNDPNTVERVFRAAQASLAEAVAKSRRASDGALDRTEVYGMHVYKGGPVSYGFDVSYKFDGKELFRLVIFRQCKATKTFIRQKVNPDGTYQQFDDVGHLPSYPPGTVKYLLPTLEEQRLERIQWLFKHYVGGTSLANLVRTMNEKEPLYFGKVWRDDHVRQILRNAAVTGRPESGKYDTAKYSRVVGDKVIALDVDRKRERYTPKEQHVRAPHALYDPIVSETLFDKVAAELDKNATGKQGGTRNRNDIGALWLRDLLVCGACEDHYIRKDKRNYRCSNYPHTCGSNTVRHDIVEAATMEYLEKIAPEIRAAIESEFDGSGLGGEATDDLGVTVGKDNSKTVNLDIAPKMVRDLLLLKMQNRHAGLQVLWEMQEYFDPGLERVGDIRKGECLEYLEGKLADVKEAYEIAFQAHKDLFADPNTRDRDKQRAREELTKAGEHVDLVEHALTDFDAVDADYNSQLETFYTSTIAAQEAMAANVDNQQKFDAVAAVIESITVYCDEDDSGYRKSWKPREAYFVPRIEAPPEAIDLTKFTDGSGNSNIFAVAGIKPVAASRNHDLIPLLGKRSQSCQNWDQESLTHGGIVAGTAHNRKDQV